jgi:hypothetical protein
MMHNHDSGNINDSTEGVNRSHGLCGTSAGVEDQRRLAPLQAEILVHRDAGIAAGDDDEAAGFGGADFFLYVGEHGRCEAALEGSAAARGSVLVVLGWGRHGTTDLFLSRRSSTRGSVMFAGFGLWALVLRVVLLLLKSRVLVRLAIDESLAGGLERDRRMSADI